VAGGAWNGNGKPGKPAAPVTPPRKSSSSAAPGGVPPGAQRTAGNAWQLLDQARRDLEESQAEVAALRRERSAKEAELREEKLRREHDLAVASERVGRKDAEMDALRQRMDRLAIEHKLQLDTANEGARGARAQRGARGTPCVRRPALLHTRTCTCACARVRVCVLFLPYVHPPLHAHTHTHTHTLTRPPTAVCGPRSCAAQPRGG
jgi:hypothetical protein